jgi:hypothetical protein
MTFNLQEECQTLQQDLSQYQVPNDHDVQSMDQASIVDLLDGAFMSMLDVTSINGGFRCHRSHSSVIECYSR